jgi:hypothetical protein
MSAVNILIDQHERARRELVPKRTDRTDRDDIGDTGALECVYVGAVIDC